MRSTTTFSCEPRNIRCYPVTPLVDGGDDEVICLGNPPFSLLNLVSSSLGRFGTELSAGDLAVGTYVFRFVNAGRVVARARFEVVP